MESNINKKLKKLDLNAIKQQENSIKEDNISSNVLNQCITENMLTKDYEKFMELLSYEDNLSDKMVDLQNPYYYIHIKEKNKNNKFDSVKYIRSKEVIIIKQEFSNNLNNKFGDMNRHNSNKTSIINNFKLDKIKSKK